MKKFLIAFAVLIQAATAASVDLSWTANAANPPGTAYNVYRATGPCAATGQTFAKLNAAPITGLAFTDAAPVNGNVYCYYATATNGSLESVPSGKSAATIPLGAPGNFSIQVNLAATIIVNGTQLAQGDKSITVTQQR